MEGIEREEEKCVYVTLANLYASERGDFEFIVTVALLITIIKRDFTACLFNAMTLYFETTAMEYSRVYRRSFHGNIKVR